MKVVKQIFADALREAGRLSLQRKSVDLGPIQTMIDPWCERRPINGVRVRKLLAAVEADTARGDLESALRQFRAVIQFVSDCDEAAKATRKLENANAR